MLKLLKDHAMFIQEEKGDIIKFRSSVVYMCLSDDHGYKKNYASIVVFNNVFR